jgi:peroxiredoxin
VERSLRKTRKIWVGLSLLLALTGCDRGQHPRQVEKKAPTFSISNDSGSVDLSKYRGKIVVLNFWATWCPPCIEELPTLMELQSKMPQVAVIAVSTDEDADAYKRFLADNHLNLTTVRDGQQRISSMYGTFRYPETYVIDRNGILRRKFIGPQTWTSPEIMDYLAKL